MGKEKRLFGSIVGLVMLGVCAQVPAADEAPIPSKWKVQEINYSYVGFTTAYDCNAAADKVKDILTTLGADASTKVRASGCPLNRPSRTFFLNITAATPIPAADVTETSADKSRQELLQRLGKKNELLDDEFPATWQSVDVTKERRLNIKPGDCELMEGLSEKVLPKLGIKIEEERISCTPNQLSLQAPYLRVSALMPLKSADTKTAEK
jgi:hypothetical protein